MRELQSQNVQEPGAEVADYSDLQVLLTSSQDFGPASIRELTVRSNLAAAVPTCWHAFSAVVLRRIGRCDWLSGDAWLRCCALLPADEASSPCCSPATCHSW